MQEIKLAQPTLVDARNIDYYEEIIAKELRESLIVGIDTETQNVNAHPGIKEIRKETDEGDSLGRGKLVFDYRRKVMTGLSLYPDGSDRSYYINLNHADEDNRVPWARVKRLLDQRNPEGSWVAHNAAYELTVFRTCYEYWIGDVICTLQMAVSAYGPDEYDTKEFAPLMFGDMKNLFAEASVLFANESSNQDPEDVDIEEVKSNRFNRKQQELLNKVLGKQSKSSYSYNRLVRQLAYTYGLKEMVKKFFGHQMATFEETLDESRHMGELTGEEVVNYGCDDAFWAVKLFYRLYDYIQTNCPEGCLQTFFEQENPMVQVFSDALIGGLRVNVPAIEARRELERKTFAANLREMKATIRALLPFREGLDARLLKDGWYAKQDKEGNFRSYTYRKNLEDWANSPDDEDDFKMACQVSNAVSNAWAGKKNKGLSITHYYQTRLMMYDLCQLNTIVKKGKVQSDGDARGELMDRVKTLLEEETNDVEKERLKHAARLLKIMGEMASIEQRMKLYLTPYLRLVDPETGCMYPEISSMLASRRMAAMNPNSMQMAKKGESVYVRGFILSDTDDEVLISIDWSQIELVLIGDDSGDPEFAKAYAQRPYKDLHFGAAADVLSVVVPEITEDMLKSLHLMDEKDIPPYLLIRPNGEPLAKDKAKSFWRGEAGKTANFNYWYSGALATTGDKLGFTSDQMWKATEKYRERFKIAEAWRLNLIEEARFTGQVILPDHHRRYRYEATFEWCNLAQRMFEAFNDPGVSRFGSEIIRATRSRAGNQIVNSKIQGSCATLAKRSILRINDEIKGAGYQARFKIPVHDELVYSVHRKEVIPFLHMAKDVMRNHPDIVKTLQIDCTASVGLTFEPFHEKKSPMGQIELDEAPACLGFGDGVQLNDDQILAAVDYSFAARDRLAA